jgi:hypothetical protein
VILTACAHYAGAALAPSIAAEVHSRLQAGDLSALTQRTRTTTLDSAQTVATMALATAPLVAQTHLRHAQTARAVQGRLRQSPAPAAQRPASLG